MEEEIKNSTDISDQSPRKWGQCLCKLYLWATAVIIPLWVGLSIWALIYGYNKDGEYCDYTKNMEHYHILIDGEPCMLQWQILWDFLLITFMWLISLQLPIWGLFLYLRGKKENK